MTKDEALKKMQAVKSYMTSGNPIWSVTEIGEAFDIAIEALERTEPQWIPIKTRPMTDEERDYWSDHFGYDVGYENDTMFDCKMPEDKQPVWVQSNCGYVYEDVCENDDGMLGLEGNGDWSDIVAWMPKYVPEPWRGES